jgi:hypothetical protein
MNQEEILKKCIEILQTHSTYSTKILAELLELDLRHNKGRILEGLEYDVSILYSKLK